MGIREFQEEENGGFPQSGPVPLTGLGLCMFCFGGEGVLLELQPMDNYMSLSPPPSFSATAF